MTDTQPDVAVEEVAEPKADKRLLWALVLISVAQPWWCWTAPS